jgi:hypothetical protein
MSAKGRKVTFHGAFATKAAAKRRESARPGSYIEKISIRGKTRYAVVTRRKR